MTIVFVEYKVFPEKRDAYSQWMKERVRDTPKMELYEGSDQPGLFVEIWHNVEEHEYREFKNERLENPESPWAELADYVPGGLDKVHIWHFRRTI